jgi:hypothetical protein
MTINFDSQAVISSRGTTRLTLDANGSYLAPFVPTFNVGGAPGTAPGADVVVAGTQNFNIGLRYNTTNGRFTALDAGIYFIRWQQLAENPTTGEFRTAIYKNGGGYGGARFITVKSGAAWWSLIAEAIVQLAANDYVTVRYESGGSNLYTDPNYGSISGHLIG